MSMGYGAIVKLALEDREHALYCYCGYTLYEDGKRDLSQLDGEILISKEMFTLRHFRYRNYEVADYVKDGLLQIKNCKNTWKTKDSIDVMAMRVFWNIHQKKMTTNVFPEEFSLNY